MRECAALLLFATAAATPFECPSGGRDDAWPTADDAARFLRVLEESRRAADHHAYFAARGADATEARRRHGQEVLQREGNEQVLDDVEGVIGRESRPGWFMVHLDGYEDRIEFQASELRVLGAPPALTENDDAALQANGWTITTHTRKTGGQAGGTYQTWLPPRGRKALRSRVEVRRYLASQQRSAPPTPAAALPPGVERLLASDAFQLAAAFR